MTDTTPNLALPELIASQAQKHVTVNEALRALDALVQLVVLDRDLPVPPGSPSEGQRWLIPAGATGAWAGHAQQIAVWQDGGWDFYQSKPGWLAYVVDEGALLASTGSAWVDAIAAMTSLNNMSLLGVGTVADATNPFSAKLNNALWVAKALAEGGDGSLRYKMSKEAAANTLSMLFQTAYSGRAELGLTGDDDFHVKVSPDGSTWTEALSIDRTSGGLRFLAYSTDVTAAATCDIGAAPSLKVKISGATTITSFGIVANAFKLVRFAGALTLTHNATSLILPTGANIATSAGDTCLAVSDASGNWRVYAYTRASGVALNMPATTTDNQLLRSDGSGGNAQGSAATLDDNGLLMTPGGFRTASISLANNSATSIAVPANFYFLFVSGVSSGARGFYHVRGGSAAAPDVFVAGAAAFALANTVLGGTTGASGAETLGNPGGGSLYIENRSGGARSYNIVIFA